MYGCASVDRLKVDRTARYSILRIVQESHCRSGSSSNCISTSAYNIDSKTSSNSDKNSNLFDGCTARTDLVHFANVNSVIINKSSKNELNMDNVQEMNAGHRGLSSLDIYDLSIKMMLSTHGCCILGKFFRLPSLETVKLAFKPLVKKLKMRYDEISDEFDGMSITICALLFCPCTMRRMHRSVYFYTCFFRIVWNLKRFVT